MTGIDWALIAGMVGTTGAALYYQVSYYKLVDDVIYVLSNLPSSDDKSEDN